jgi:hypothetical protein
MTGPSTIEEILESTEFAPTMRAIAGRWGERTPRQLLVSERADGYHRGATRAGDSVRRMHRISLAVQQEGPLAWVTVIRPHTGKNWFHYVWTGKRLARREAVEAFQAVVLDGKPEVPRDAEHLLRAFEILTPGRAIRSPEKGEPALWGNVTHFADPAAARQAHAPRVEGQEYVFCATHPWAGKLRRLRVHLGTFAVTAEVLGRCHKAPVPRGREYASPGGSVQAGLIEAPLVPWEVPAPPGARRALGQAWRQAALGEHASVASFARASLELMALGAPLDLLRRTHLAALDEIRHAELAFAIAVGFDRCSLVAGPLAALAPREPSRTQVALDTLREAALPETLAAAEMQAAAVAALDPELGAVLREVAADEARHAALAWEVIEWCASSPLSPAWGEALRAARIPGLPAGPPVLSGYGILDPEEHRQLSERVWAGQIAPRLERLRRAASGSEAG